MFAIQPGISAVVEYVPLNSEMRRGRDWSITLASLKIGCQS